MSGTRRPQKDGAPRKVISKVQASPVHSPKSPTGRRHCHVCRSPKDVTKIVSCSSGKRSHIFCSSCVERRLLTSFASVQNDPRWICPKCRDCCPCSKCRKRENQTTATTATTATPQVQQKTHKQTTVVVAENPPSPKIKSPPHKHTSPALCSTTEDTDAALTLLTIKHSPKPSWDRDDETSSPSTGSESGPMYSFPPLSDSSLPSFSPSAKTASFYPPYSSSPHIKQSQSTTPTTPSQESAILIASLALHNSPSSVASSPIAGHRRVSDPVQPLFLSPSISILNYDETFPPQVHNSFGVPTSSKGSLRVYEQQQQQQQQSQSFVAPRHIRASSFPEQKKHNAILS